MSRTTRVRKIIKKTKKTNRDRFGNLVKKKRGTPMKVSSKPSTKRARISSVKRTLSALERDSGANILLLMHTPNEAESTYRTRSYGPLGKKLVKEAPFNLLKLQFKTYISQFEETRSGNVDEENLPEDREQEMESSNEQEITEAIKQFTISGKTIEDLTTEDSADSEDDVDRITAKMLHKKSSKSPVKRTTIYSSDSERESVSEASLSKKRLNDEPTSSVNLANNDSVTKNGRSSSKKSITEPKKNIKNGLRHAHSTKKASTPKKGCPKTAPITNKLKDPRCPKELRVLLKRL